MGVKISQKTKIEAHTKTVLGIGLAASFILGLAFATALFKDTNLIESNKIVEAPQEIEETQEARSNIVIDNTDLTVFSLSENTKDAYDELKLAVQNQGGRVFLNVDGNVFAKVDNVQNVKNNITTVVSSFNYEDLQALGPVKNSQQNILEDILYTEGELPDQEKFNLGDDVYETINQNSQLDNIVFEEGTALSSASSVYHESPATPNHIGLKGDIFVEFIFVESVDNSFNWQDGEVQEIYANFVNGLLILARTAPEEMDLSFTISLSDHKDPLNQVQNDPVSSDQSKYQFELMQNREVCLNVDADTGGCLDGSSQAWDIVDEYAYQKAQSLGYPQAFIAMVVRDNEWATSKGGDTWPHAAFRHSLIVLNRSYGLNFSTGGRWPITDMYVAAHESAHIFLAWDQYLSGKCYVSLDSPEHLRVQAAGHADNLTANNNSIGCGPYMPSLMKGGMDIAGRYVVSEPPEYLQGGLPANFSMDWYAMAQVNWGDQAEGIRLEINKPYSQNSLGFVFNEASGPINIYIDGKYFASYVLRANDLKEYLFIPLKEGSHTIDIKGSYGIESVAGPVSFNITNTLGPNGPTQVSIDLQCTSGDCLVCQDGTFPGTCNAENEYCSDEKLTSSDCRQCGCPSDTFCGQTVSGTYICQIINTSICDRDPDDPSCLRDKIE